MPNHRASDDIRAIDDMAEPRGPRAVVRDAAPGGRNHRNIVRPYGLLDQALVEAGASASWLVDHEHGQVVAAHRIGQPSFPSIRCRFEAGPGMRGPVHHDEGPLTAVL